MFITEAKSQPSKAPALHPRLPRVRYPPRRDNQIKLVKTVLDNPAKAGVTLTLLTRSLTGLVVGLWPENTCPVGTDWFVGPNPTPKCSTVSPAFAATVE
jgi:hypothetical protein